MFFFALSPASRTVSKKFVEEEIRKPSTDFSGPTKLLQLRRNWGTEMLKVLFGVTAGLSPLCFPAEASRKPLGSFSGPLGLALLLPLAERDLAWSISEMPRGQRGHGSPWNPS